MSAAISRTGPYETRLSAIVTRSIVMRNGPQRMFPRNRPLKCLHREKSHEIRFLGFGIFGQSKYPSLSQFFYIFEER